MILVILRNSNDDDNDSDTDLLLLSSFVVANNGKGFERVVHVNVETITALNIVAITIIIIVIVRVVIVVVTDVAIIASAASIFQSCWAGKATPNFILSLARSVGRFH